MVTHGDPATRRTSPQWSSTFSNGETHRGEGARGGNKGDWPLITLNLDFKDNKPEHLAEVLALLRKYQAWITSAPKADSIDNVEAARCQAHSGFTGEPDAQQKVFYDELKPGERVLAFGAIHTAMKNPQAAPEVIGDEKANNYRRWWNNRWNVVEPKGQQRAGEWTEEKMTRLRALVERAHANGLWIRFYTLDGVTEKELSCNGWFPEYNFGTLDAAKVRWRAAQAAGVDYIASDQYETLARELKTGH